MENVAQTILAQLGGRKFIAMTGAKNLINEGNGLTCKIGRNGKGVTHFRVTLDLSDTYKVEFFKWNARALELKLLTEFEGVYCDQLRELFTAQTGLYTSLAG